MHQYTQDEQSTFEKFNSKRYQFTGRKDKLEVRRYVAQADAKAAGCAKLAFPSKSEAQERMWQINAGGGTTRTSLRAAYRCPQCGQWHLTSQRQTMSRSHARSLEHLHGGYYS